MVFWRKTAGVDRIVLLPYTKTNGNRMVKPIEYQPSFVPLRGITEWQTKDSGPFASLRVNPLAERKTSPAQAREYLIAILAIYGRTSGKRTFFYLSATELC
jgi:hypothetical protein